MDKNRLIFYRRLTGNSVDELPDKAAEFLCQMDSSYILKTLIKQDLQKHSLNQVAIKYSVTKSYVKAIARKYKISKKGSN